MECHNFQLLDCGGTIDVACHEQNFFVLLFEIKCQLSAHCCLACALQTAHHIHCGLTVTDGKFLGFAAHKLNELFIDYLYDLLVGGEGFQDIFTNGLFADGCNKLLYNLKVDVRFKQCNTDFSHGLFDFKLGESALVAEL